MAALNNNIHKACKIVTWSDRLSNFVKTQFTIDMKSYSFAKVSAREYLTMADYNNKYIITDDLKQIINVSGRDFEEPLNFFKEREIIARNMPLTEKNGDMGYKTLLEAVGYLLFWDKRDKRSIVCCAFGVNRSRTVIEAFHYAKMGFHFEDEYEGYANHLIYNCAIGCLPPLSEVEYELKRLGEEYNDDIQDLLKSLKSQTSTKCYNDLAEKTETFIHLIKELNIGDDKYENLAPIMSCFSQLKIRDGYVLDGFQAGLPHFDSSMYLHARKECGTEFVPFDWDDFHRQWFRLSFQKNEEESKKLKESVRDFFKVFNDSHYIRKSVCSMHAEEFVRPIWKDITVPFNRDGIWEAALLYIAPRLMSGYWHWIYCRITPVTSDAVLASKCKTQIDYDTIIDSNLLYPRVDIIDNESAAVQFAAWGYYGLELWKLDVTKDGDSVKVEWAKDEQKRLVYYKPKFVV
jgi:hypothetical protein